MIHLYPHPVCRDMDRFPRPPVTSTSILISPSWPTSTYPILLVPLRKCQRLSPGTSGHGGHRQTFCGSPALFSKGACLDTNHGAQSAESSVYLEHSSYQIWPVMKNRLQRLAGLG